MLPAVTSTTTAAWSDGGWEHVEVVDSVLVEERAQPPLSEADHGLYDRRGRLATSERRYGTLVSVVA